MPTLTVRRVPGVVQAGGARMVALAAGFVCSVLSVRVVIDGYGLQTFAAVSVISTLVALVPFADLGLGIALANLATEHARGEHRNRLGPAILGVLATLAGVGALLIVGAVVVTQAGWIGGSDTLRNLGDPQIYLPAYAVAVALWLLGGPSYRVLAGAGRAPALIMLQGLTPLLSLIATFTAVQLDATPWVLTLIPVLGATATSGVAWWLAFTTLARRHPVTWSFITWPGYSRLMTQGRAGLLVTIGTAALLQPDRVLVSTLGGPGDLAKAAILLPPFVAVQSLLGSAGTYLWPHYRNRRLDGDLHLPELRRHVVISAAAGAGLAVVFAGLMPIYLVVVGYNAGGVWEATFILGAVIVAQSTTLVPSSFLTSPDLVRVQGLVSFATGAAKVGLALLLVRAIGVEGTFAATLLAVGVVQLPIYLRLMARRADA